MSVAKLGLLAASAISLAAFYLVGFALFDAFTLDLGSLVVLTPRYLTFVQMWLLFGGLSSVFLTLALARHRDSRDRLDRLMARLTDVPGRYFVASSCVVAMVVPLILRTCVLRGAPLSDDEGVYRFGADLLASGRLWAASPPLSGWRPSRLHERSRATTCRASSVSRSSKDSRGGRRRGARRDRRPAAGDRRARHLLALHRHLGRSRPRAGTQIIAPQFGRLLTWTLATAGANDVLQAGFAPLTHKTNEVGATHLVATLGACAASLWPLSRRFSPPGSHTRAVTSRERRRSFSTCGSTTARRRSPATRALLTTVSPNDDGFRDGAHDPLPPPGTGVVTMDVTRTVKVPQVVVYTLTETLGAGAHTMVWDPRETR